MDLDDPIQPTIIIWTGWFGSPKAEDICNLLVLGQNIKVLGNDINLSFFLCSYLCSISGLNYVVIVRSLQTDVDQKNKK
jgi:energy-converting hydrogenase Eha subunit B